MNIPWTQIIVQVGEGMKPRQTYQTEENKRTRKLNDNTKTLDLLLGVLSLSYLNYVKMVD